jgi:hypothetical protein
MAYPDAVFPVKIQFPPEVLFYRDMMNPTSSAARFQFSVEKTYRVR